MTIGGRGRKFDGASVGAHCVLELMLQQIEIPQILLGIIDRSPAAFVTLASELPPLQGDGFEMSRKLVSAPCRLPPVSSL